MTPYIAVERESHSLELQELLVSPDPPGQDAPEVKKMKHRLKTPTGRSIYAQRKCTPEPVFGIIKSVLGFRQFSLRGIEAVDGDMESCQHRLEFEANPQIVVPSTGDDRGLLSPVGQSDLSSGQMSKGI